MGPFIILAVAAIMLVGGLVWRDQLRKARDQADRERRAAERTACIRAKYGNNSTADKIIEQTVWTGESAEQLRDSLGSPVDIDQKVLKTKRKEVWKYRHMGANRYGVRITLENGFVVGWDEKS